jgi:hypothetical protein
MDSNDQSSSLNCANPAGSGLEQVMRFTMLNLQKFTETQTETGSLKVSPFFRFCNCLNAAAIFRPPARMIGAFNRLTSSIIRFSFNR